MTKTTLRWRLSKLPEPLELLKLVDSKIITQEEAKAILFVSENEDERDKKSLESEIKFLRELVDKLSSSHTKTIEIIKEVEKPYWKFEWYKPYQVWCANNQALYSYTATDNTLNQAQMNLQYQSNPPNTTFTSIQTF